MILILPLGPTDSGRCAFAYTDVLVGVNRYVALWRVGPSSIKTCSAFIKTMAAAIRRAAQPKLLGLTATDPSLE